MNIEHLIIPGGSTNIFLLYAIFYFPMNIPTEIPPDHQKEQTYNDDTDADTNDNTDAD